jgi:hypothetical protein
MVHNLYSVRLDQLGEDAPKITESENSSKMIPLTDQSVYM